MTISRRQRRVEEQKLSRLNARKHANKNLKKNLTVLGAGLFFSGVAVQASSAVKSHQAYADLNLDQNNQTTDQTAANTNVENTVNMITPRGVGDQLFINYIGNSAQKLAANNDLYASVMIAQAMIESGWGTSGLASAPNYNLFGIKGSYKGTAVNMPTQEDDGTGTLYSIQANFKKYPSYKESLEDYVSLLRGGVSGNPQLYAGTWKSNAQTYQDATSFLTGKYATDTSYGDKLNNIINKYNLTRFDQPLDANDQSQTYVFAQGDTLQSVADKFNISLETLMNLNGLKTASYVYPGKTLVVNQVVDSNGTSATNNQPIAVSSVNKPAENDIYEDQQAPVIVQDETGGVKKYQASQDSKNDSVATGVQIDQSNNQQKTQAGSENSQSVTVKAGDTLDGIARQNGISIEQLKQINKLNSDLLVVGQQLML